MYVKKHISHNRDRYAKVNINRNNIQNQGLKSYLGLSKDLFCEINSITFAKRYFEKWIKIS